MTPAARAEALVKLVQTERASQSIGTVTPVLTLMCAGMAIAFAFVPGGQRSAAIIAGFTAVGLAGCLINRSGRNRLAAILLVAMLILAPAVEPLVTRDLSTNTAFAGITGVLALMFSEWRYRWWVLAAVATVTAVTILRTTAAETVPVPRLGAAVSGTALLVISLVTGLWLLHSYRSMIQQAAGAQRVAEARAAELAQVNSGLAAAVAGREAELATAIDARRALAQQLAEAAARDPLTGLFNRHHLDQQLPAVGSCDAVALLDVDLFKRINDTYSYAVGDHVLQELATTLGRLVDPPAVLARYGGEEFALLLPQSTATAAQELADRLRAAVAAYPWADIQPGLAVTVSVGVCVCAGPSDAAGDAAEEAAEEFDGATMLRCADRALARAKATGRDRAVTLTCNQP